MANAAIKQKKPLGVRATAEQHRLIAEAARREHRSISNFVLSAALKAAEVKERVQSSKFSDEEAAAILKRAQAAFRSSGDYGRDLVEELLAERRADVMRG